MPPKPLAIGGKLRFAAGSPNSLRSSTWMVLGGTNDRDVYVSSRSLLSLTKISFHASGRWRVAMTSESGLSLDGDWKDTPLRRADDDPRVAMRLTPPPAVNGWRQALDIVVSEPGLQVPFPEKRVKGGAINWWGAPTGDIVRTFGVFIGEPGVEYAPDAPPLSDDLVGSIQLPGGSHVVVFTKLFYRPDEVALVRQTRQEFEDVGNRQHGAYNPLLLRTGKATTTVLDLGFDPAD